MKSRVFAPLILLTAFVSNGFATDVYVNDPIITGILPVANTTVFGATYRVENGGGNGDQTLGLDEAGTAIAGPYLGRNLGNRTQLTTIEWNFELEHIIGQGLVFTLSRLNGSTLVEHIIGWGTFAPALPGGSTVDPTLPNPVGAFTPESPYNAINLSVSTTLQASETNSVAIGGLIFSSPTLTLSAGSAFVGMFGSNNTDAFQQILLDGDFAQHNWTVTGTVTIVKSNNGCPECAVFAITGSTVEADFPAAAIPEPASFGYAAGGLLLLIIGSLGRRR
jgi:hypothetical protein